MTINRLGVDETLVNKGITRFSLSLLACVCFMVSAWAASFVELTDVAQAVMQYQFQPKGSFQQLLHRWSSIPPQQQKTKGVFVTLSHHGKTRACWGSVFPQYKNLVEATAYATQGALTKEYRYPPIQSDELPQLTIQVTIVDKLQPIQSIRQINPLRDGLMVRSGGKAGIILPGETVDAHYQLVQAKLKAGIGQNEPFSLTRIIAHVIQKQPA